MNHVLATSIPLVKLGAQLFENAESREKVAYKDSLGILTIGVGRNIQHKGLSDDEINYILANDIKEAIDDLETFPWFASLSDARKAVMIDMRAQLGPSRFRAFRKMMQAIASGQIQLAADEMKNSTWYEQVPNRAKRNIRIWLTGEIQKGDLA